MLLPVGSVVYLIDGNQKLVIVNRGAIVEQEGQEVYFDYLGGIFPEGLNLEQVYYFNQEDIDEVVFEGYHDEEEERVSRLIENVKMLLIDVMIHLSEENEKGFTKLQFFTRQIVVGVNWYVLPKINNYFNP
ncbi:hypothetical protein SaSA201_1461 [Streptococcus agalactiae]|nr:hypothetical protein SaSA20_1410 [Streptococcus agalactiae]AUO92419.1 hypothetical protein SaSA16_1456 [Streptococcus agalactiae]AUO97426.1 hypothetical protein SaSA81_1455 [Streptococcus agalactiae]AUP08636.1 hypothetical protein SaSA159_1458 [Streptococcus agalactiae]AUP10226.1 hypothetical protein SaSA184_1463 [Streptococcus agalactiae]